MAEKRFQRLGHAVQRRWRILQGFVRFYGGKLRDGARRMARGRIRWAGFAVVIVLAAGLAWRGLGGLPGVSSLGQNEGDWSGGRLPAGRESGGGLAETVPEAERLVADDKIVVVPAGNTPEVTTGDSRATSPRSVASAGRASAGESAAVIVPPEERPRPGPPQPQAERPAAALAGLAPPVDGDVVAGPGWRRHRDFGHWHYDPGIQLMAPSGSAVRAVLPGTVAETGPDPSGGLRVAIDHGDGLTTVYGHLEHVVLAPGQSVSAHAAVGYAADAASRAPVRFAVYVDGEAIDPTTVLTDL